MESTSRRPVLEWSDQWGEVAREPFPAGLYNPTRGGQILSHMATVKLTRHLYPFFPALEGKDIAVEASTVAEVVQEMERLAPGFAFYVCDERGRLRRHVNIFVEQAMVADRARLSDRVAPDARVFILQALSGG